MSRTGRPTTRGHRVSDKMNSSPEHKSYCPECGRRVKTCECESERAPGFVAPSCCAASGPESSPTVGRPVAPDDGSGYWESLASAMESLCRVLTDKSASGHSWVACRAEISRLVGIYEDGKPEPASERTEPKSEAGSTTDPEPFSDLNPQTEASGRRNESSAGTKPAP